MISKAENKISHLSEYELAIAADAIVGDRYDSLGISTRDHLSGCEKCSSHLMELTDVIEDVNQDNVIELNGKIKSIVVYRWVSAVAVIVIIGLSSVILNYKSKVDILVSDMNYLSKSTSGLINPTKNDSMSYHALQKLLSDHSKLLIEQKDSLNQLRLEQQSANNLIASLYRPNLKLEEEMALTLRSGSLKLLSPNTIKFNHNKELMFKWEGGPFVLDLVIYNNQGLKIKTDLKVKNGHHILLDKFNIGVYYFELYSENELVLIKKFEIY